MCNLPILVISNRSFKIYRQCFEIDQSKSKRQRLSSNGIRNKGKTSPGAAPGVHFFPSPLRAGIDFSSALHRQKKRIGRGTIDKPIDYDRAGCKNRGRVYR